MPGTVNRISYCLRPGGAEEFGWELCQNGIDPLYFGLRPLMCFSETGTTGTTTYPPGKDPAIPCITKCVKLRILSIPSVGVLPPLAPTWQKEYKSEFLVSFVFPFIFPTILGRFL